MQLKSTSAATCRPRRGELEGWRLVDSPYFLLPSLLSSFLSFEVCGEAMGWHGSARSGGVGGATGRQKKSVRMDVCDESVDEQ